MKDVMDSRIDIERELIKVLAASMTKKIDREMMGHGDDPGPLFEIPDPKTLEEILGEGE